MNMEELRIKVIRAVDEVFKNEESNSIIIRFNEMTTQDELLKIAENLTELLENSPSTEENLLEVVVV